MVKIREAYEVVKEAEIRNKIKRGSRWSWERRGSSRLWQTRSEGAKVEETNINSPSKQVDLIFNIYDE